MRGTTDASLEITASTGRVPLPFTLLVLVVAVGVASHAVATPARFATEASVGGTVVEAGSSAPLVGAEVTVVEIGVAVRTDAWGRFLIAALSPGAYTLRVGHAGHVTVERAIRVAAGVETGDVSFALERYARFLTEVVVTPSRYSLYREEPGARTSLSREEVKRTPHFGEDPLRTLRWLPGVTGEDLSSRSNVRGGDADETLLVLDGVEIQEGFHLKELFSLLSVIDAEALDGLEFMSGGFPVEYGNRMSGVIDMSSASGRTARTSVGVSTVNLGLLSEGSFADGRGGWVVSARRTDLDAAIRWVDPDLGLEPNFHDGFVKVGFTLGDRTELSATALAARDRIHYTEVDGRVEELMDTSSTIRYGWLTARTSWGSRLYSRAILSTGSVDRERSGFIDYWYQEGTADDRRSFDVTGFKQDWIFRASDRQLVKWGIDLERVEAGYDYASHSIVRDPLFIGGGEAWTTDRDYDLGFDGNTYAIYAADRVRVGKSLIVEAGARWDRQTTTRENQLSPRLDVSCLLGDRTTVRAGWGLYSQPQRLDELQVTDGVTTFFPAQRAEHRLLSLDHAFAGGYELRAEVYQKVLTDIRPRYENLLNPIEIFPELEADRVLVAPERGEARGIELMVRRPTGRRWTWWASYAYARATERIGGESYRRSWDQPHTVNLSVNFRPSTRWNLSLAGTYHTGWPTTAVYGDLITQPDGSQWIRPRLGRRNGERLDGYARLDLRVSRDVHLRRGLCSLFLEVTNLLNRDNQARPESFAWWLDDRGVPRLSVDYESFLPVIVSLGVRWTM